MQVIAHKISHCGVYRLTATPAQGCIIEMFRARSKQLLEPLAQIRAGSVLEAGPSGSEDQSHSLLPAGQGY